jgi:DNA repair exonuclease SbcCD ATPase subunit
MFAITYATWKIPLDSANEQVKALEAQVQAANQRADRMRDALARAQEALNALNEALQEISPQGTKTQQAPTSGGEQTSPCPVMGESEHAVRNFSTPVPKLR